MGKNWDNYNRIKQTLKIVKSEHSNCLISRHNKGTVMKRVWHHNQDTQLDQCNRITSSETDPHIQGQLSFDRYAKQLSGERSLLSK